MSLDLDLEVNLQYIIFTKIQLCISLDLDLEGEQQRPALKALSPHLVRQLYPSSSTSS